MMEYVLGFAFDEQGSVALIKKTKPEWQAGRFNGVGGKVETTDDTIEDAMQREFFEETGVTIHADQWRKVGAITGTGYRVHVYTVRSRRVETVRTTTDEKVLLATCRWINQNYERLLPNVHTLIQAALMTPNESGDRPYVELRYP